jgi:hypothetical protein
MNIKYFLVIVCVLTFFQPMHAIKVTVINKKHRGGIEVTVGAKWRVNMPTQFLSTHLKFKKSSSIELGVNSIIMNVGINYLKGQEWVLFQEDLIKHDIPAWGRHDIIIYIEDSSGLLGVVVDRGKKIFINAEPIGFMEEDV